MRVSNSHIQIVSMHSAVDFILLAWVPCMICVCLHDGFKCISNWWESCWWLWPATCQDLWLHCGRCCSLMKRVSKRCLLWVPLFWSWKASFMKLHLKRTLEQAKLLRMWIILVYASWLCRVWLSFRCVAMELTFLPTGAASTGKQRWSASKHFGPPIFQVLCLECSTCQAIQAAIFAMLLRHNMRASCWVQLQHWLLRVWEQRYVWPRKVSWFARQSCPWVAREIFTAGTSQLHWSGFVWSKWSQNQIKLSCIHTKDLKRHTCTFHVSLTIWFGLSKGRVLRRASGKSSVQTMERPLLDNMITSGVKAGSTRSAFKLEHKLSRSIKHFRIIELSKQTFEVSITFCLLVLGLGGSRAQ